MTGKKLRHREGMSFKLLYCPSYLMLQSWLYSWFVGEDTCFKQKARQRKHDDADPQLSPGLGLFVDPVRYSTLLSSVKDQNEVR